MRYCAMGRALRRALPSDLAPYLDADTLVVDELDLCGLTRVDVAVVNGHLSGFEIKGSTDSLRRLPGQVTVYSQVQRHPAAATGREAMIVAWLSGLDVPAT